MLGIYDDTAPTSPSFVSSHRESKLPIERKKRSKSSRPPTVKGSGSIVPDNLKRKKAKAKAKAKAKRANPIVDSGFLYDIDDEGIVDKPKKDAWENSFIKEVNSFEDDQNGGCRPGFIACGAMSSVPVSDTQQNQTAPKSTIEWFFHLSDKVGDFLLDSMERVQEKRQQKRQVGKSSRRRGGKQKNKSDGYPTDATASSSSGDDHSPVKSRRRSKRHKHKHKRREKTTPNERRPMSSQPPN